jgi:hypothetical protein
MAPPPLRRMKRASSVAEVNSPIAARTAIGTASTPRMPPPQDVAFTPKSPFRRVNDGRITKSQKQGLLDNLEVECTYFNSSDAEGAKMVVHSERKISEAPCSNKPAVSGAQTADRNAHHSYSEETVEDDHGRTVSPDRGTRCDEFDGHFQWRKGVHRGSSESEVGL